MHYSVILNPDATGGNAQTIWALIEEQLNTQNVDYGLMTTKSPSDFAFFARRLYQSWRATDTTVIVVGGDGTLHRAINALVQTAQEYGLDPLPVAYIPTSRVSRFARAYGISLDPVHALSQILAADGITNVALGHYRDALKGQDSYFLNGLGIGFDAALINLSRKKRQRRNFRVGMLRFLFQTIAVIYHQQSFSLMVRQKRRRTLFTSAYIILVANHPYLDSGFVLESDNNIGEEKLELIVAERRGWPITIWQLIQFYRGKLGESRFATKITGQRFQLTTTSLEFSQTDGEYYGNRFTDIAIDVSTYPFRQAH
ncbi:MAG: diacylglycerol kinase family protein [Limosilactobacillus sp.]|uniref:diacylglycerol/lipid kinase family protein n=1 Tax=Limosilactobacillus sp. TaxID=2773925 RepID=UPI0027057E10|nr:diacylglycerol kinase family protein [Limosilactobacillus sp.]